MVEYVTVGWKRLPFTWENFLRRYEMWVKKNTYPQTRFAKPTIIPEAKIAYPALRDSGS